MQGLHWFHVMPSDQHLWMDGHELVGDDCTLAQLAVSSGSVIIVKVSAEDAVCSQGLYCMRPECNKPMQSELACVNWLSVCFAGVQRLQQIF